MKVRRPAQAFQAFQAGLPKDSKGGTQKAALLTIPSRVNVR